MQLRWPLAAFSLAGVGALLAGVLLVWPERGDVGPIRATAPARQAVAPPLPRLAVEDLRVERPPGLGLPPPIASASEPAWAAPSGPLPPPGLPLAELLDPLLARAEAGDARAACRLAAELTDCALGPMPTRSQGDEVLAAGLEPEVRAALQAQRTEAAQRAARCRGVDPATHHLALDLLLLAAERGDAFSRWALLRGGGLLGPRMVERPESLRHWRDAALALLKARIAQGDVRAALQYRHALRTHGTLLDAAIPDDPVEAAAFELVLRRLVPGFDPGEPIDALDEAARAAAAQRAAALLAGPYARAEPLIATPPPPPPPPAPPAGAAPLPDPPPAWSLRIANGAVMIPPAHCE